jgi:hypothetical protein
MNRALWLLLWFRFWGWLRRVGRAMRTVKGALFIAFGVLICSCWLVSVLVTPRRAEAVDPAALRRYGSLALLAYCLLVSLTSAGDKAVYFSPAEVNLLFAGPFSRRQLLAYKIVTAVLLSLVSALFLMLWLRVYARWLPAAFLGIVLVLLFSQLFAMSVALVSSTIGAHAYNLRRKVVLIALAGLLLLAALSVDRQALPQSPEEWLDQAERSPAFRVVLAPFGWFLDTFTAERLWPDLLAAALRALAVNAVLLVLVFLLDAQYLETAAATSERVYARLERLRSGGPALAPAGASGKVRLTLPDLPWWGGAGPIAWRQLLAALRNFKGLVVFLLIMGFVLLRPVLSGGADREADAALSHVLGGTVFAMSVFLLPLLPFDFRGDVDRMEVLKSLPVRPSRVVIGQLIAPVVFTSVLQVVGLLVIEAAVGGLGPLLGIGVLFLLPFNSLVFSVANLLFLWFPTRIAPATAGDFQLMGRQVLYTFGLYLALLLLVGAAALAATVVYFVSGGSWPAALAVAWLMLAGFVAGLVPLLALAFQRFDVARDTPP